MPQHTIRIACYDFLSGRTVHDDISADVDGAFGIHETIPMSLDGYTLTHIPTGYAVLSHRLKRPLVAARAELLASGLNWEFSNPRAVTDAHRRIGQAVRAKYREAEE